MLAWVDIETTGLIPEQGSILEVALLVTDDDLRPLDEGVSVLVKPLASTIEKMDTYVRNMHEKNGLLVACQADGVRRRYEVEEQLRAYMGVHYQMTSTQRKLPMCGSSVHFDRAWLKVHMPELEKMFAYRNVDVSSFFECAIRWLPGAAVNTKVEGPHRAMPDVLNSIEHLRRYRAALFGKKEAA